VSRGTQPPKFTRGYTDSLINDKPSWVGSTKSQLDTHLQVWPVSEVGTQLPLLQLPGPHCAVGSSRGACSAPCCCLDGLRKHPPLPPPSHHLPTQPPDPLSPNTTTTVTYFRPSPRPPPPSLNPGSLPLLALPSYPPQPALPAPQPFTASNPPPLCPPHQGGPLPLNRARWKLIPWDDDGGNVRHTTLAGYKGLVEGLLSSLDQPEEACCGTIALTHTSLSQPAEGRY
jgi:hypothetical protein